MEYGITTFHICGEAQIRNSQSVLHHKRVLQPFMFVVEHRLAVPDLCSTTNVKGCNAKLHRVTVVDYYFLLVG